MSKYVIRDDGKSGNIFQVGDNMVTDAEGNMYTAIGENMAIDTKGNTYMRFGENMITNTTTGESHLYYDLPKKGERF